MPEVSTEAQFPHRISIHDRPEIINQNVEFGHFEGDSVEGLGHKDGVHTEVERVSRRYFVKPVKSISSEETVRAQKKMFKPLPVYHSRCDMFLSTPKR